MAGSRSLNARFEAAYDRRPLAAFALHLVANLALIGLGLEAVRALAGWGEPIWPYAIGPAFGSTIGFVIARRLRRRR